MTMMKLLVTGSLADQQRNLINTMDIKADPKPQDRIGLAPGIWGTVESIEKGNREVAARLHMKVADADYTMLSEIPGWQPGH